MSNHASSWERIAVDSLGRQHILVRGVRRIGYRVPVFVQPLTGRCAIALTKKSGDYVYIVLDDLDARDPNADAIAAARIRDVHFVLVGPTSATTTPGSSQTRTGRPPASPTTSARGSRSTASSGCVTAPGLDAPTLGGPPSSHATPSAMGGGDRW